MTIRILCRTYTCIACTSVRYTGLGHIQVSQTLILLLIIHVILLNMINLKLTYWDTIRIFRSNFFPFCTSFVKVMFFLVNPLHDAEYLFYYRYFKPKLAYETILICIQMKQISAVLSMLRLYTRLPV